MKNTHTAVGKPLIAENRKQSLFDVTAKVIGLCADESLDFQGDKERPIDFQIVTRHSKGFDMGTDLGFEIFVNIQTALAIDGQKPGMPASCPARNRRRLLNSRMTFRNMFIIFRGNSALLSTKGVRRALPYIFDGFRISSALTRRQVSHPRNSIHVA